MRRLLWAAAALGAGCGTTGSTGGGTVSVVLDIPNATLDPKGYSSVELRLHGASGDLERNVPVVNGTFDLGDLDPMTQVSVDAVLRTDTGEAVGYGRSSTPMDLVAGATLTVPVRRPIVYFAGLVSSTNPNTMVTHWTEAPATFGDLSTGTIFDGTTTLSGNTVLMVSAGPALFEVQQGTSDPDGTLMGNATIVPVSTGDHSVSAPMSAMLQGGALDGAGTDDGKLLVIGTTQHLYLVDAVAGNAASIADGEFDRVAIVMNSDGSVSAVAVKNRSATTGTCASTAELVWVDVIGGDTTMGMVTSLGTGGFSDVASDRGHAYYVDQCKGELGEAAKTGITSKRTQLGRATALAVSGVQAWIGVEKPGKPAQVSLLSASISGSDPPRTLYSNNAVQVVEAPDYPGVQRSMDADSAVFNQLEVGAGGDYVATTVSSHYLGNAIADANFPQIEMFVDELRVFDAASGAAVQRYRSWCDGTITIRSVNDIMNWGCATETGQSAPSNPNLDHKLGSMTFLFGEEMTRILVLLCLLCGIARADVDPKRKLIVLEYRSGSSAMPHLADRIVARLAKQTSLNVLGPDQTRAVYGEHLDLVIVKCAGDPECVARIGQKVGAAEVILVGISELGDVILTIQRIDVATRTVSSRLADSVPGGSPPNEQKLDGYLTKLLPASDFLRYGIIDIISSESGALVTVGGEHRGTTPIGSLKLKAPASYEIRIEKRGFQAYTTSVQLPADGELRVRANLARPGGAPSWWQHWYVLAPAALIVAGAAGGTIYFTTEQSATAGPLKGVGSIQ